MFRKRLILIGVIVGVVLLAGAGAWYFFLGGDEPPPAALTESSGEDAGSGSAEAPDSLDGPWATVPGDQANPTFAGYRVTETVLGVGRSSEAVGRTTSVDGTLTISGTEVTEAEFTADLSGLQSDESRRDSVLRDRGLQTAQFPEATFRLTEPIDLQELPAPGEAISVTATGELTLHGETRPISMPLQAVLTADSEPRIEIAGGVEIAMADYGIEPPSVGGFVTVEDRGTIEVHLVLESS
jgi:polyisoprenoid-binding protein YceI